MRIEFTTRTIVISVKVLGRVGVAGLITDGAAVETSGTYRHNHIPRRGTGGRQWCVIGASSSLSSPIQRRTCPCTVRRSEAEQIGPSDGPNGIKHPLFFVAHVLFSRRRHSG